MNKLKLFAIILLLSLGGVAEAQISARVTVGSPPMWSPAGYPEVRYYYLPAVHAYYDVYSSSFIYYSKGAWVYQATLPYQYRNYDLYSGYKVVLTDYHGTTPYTNFATHKRNYSRKYNGGSQQTIGDHPGSGNAGEKRGPAHNDRTHRKKKH